MLFTRQYPPNKDKTLLCQRFFVEEFCFQLSYIKSFMLITMKYINWNERKPELEIAYEIDSIQVNSKNSMLRFLKLSPQEEKCRSKAENLATIELLHCFKNYSI